MSINIVDFKPKSEPPFGLTERDFTSVNDLVHTPIIVTGVKPFENDDNGPGVFIRFRYTTADPGEFRYTTTHAINLVKVFANEDLIALLESGEEAVVTIVKRASKKNPKLTVFDVQ